MSASSLRAAIEAACDATGASLKSYTVLSPQTDPFRIDTPANQRDAQWLRAAWIASAARRPLHLRGLHYALISMAPAPTMPNGDLYTNTDENWLWLEAVAGRARWLQIIPFDWITDGRNAAPVDCTALAPNAEFEIRDGATLLSLPSNFEALLPEPILCGSGAKQAYRLVLIGEKSSLADVLLPIANAYQAELVLPTGELSTTLLCGIVDRARNDGRPTRIFYLADFDPAGFAMPINTARKLQAFCQDQALDIQLRRLALTADQVRELGLPSTPLKETERRADRWRERFGCEQTEIDALGTLRPQILQTIVKEALDRYFDHDLVDKAQRCAMDATYSAHNVMAEAIADRADEVAAVRSLYEAARDAARQAFVLADPLFAAIADEVTERLTLPDWPEPDCEGDADNPLFCASRSWTTQTEDLRRDQL